jgi:hypothetical protein
MDNRHSPTEELLIDELREEEILAMTQRMRELESTTDCVDQTDA